MIFFNAFRSNLIQVFDVKKYHILTCEFSLLIHNDFFNSAP